MQEIMASLMGMPINRREVVTFSAFIFVCSVRGRRYTKQKMVE